MTKAEINRLLAILTATYPSHPIPDPDALVLAWEIGVGDVSFEAASEAVVGWIRSAERFFPAPGQIRALVPKAIEPLALPEPPSEMERPKYLYRLLDEATGDFIELDPPRVLTPELAAERRRYWFGDAR